MSSNNESAREITNMNQTMSTSFELKKPAGLQAGRDFRSTHFISNIQNVSQNMQATFTGGQPKSNGADDPQERNPTNPKATSSMISSEIFTHYKKQKIQNLMNESSAAGSPLAGLVGDQALSSANSGKTDFRSLSLVGGGDAKAGGGATFSLLNQINQTASQMGHNPLSNQLISPFGSAQGMGYPESSLSSPGSTGSSDSNDQAPVEHDLPVDLKIKSRSHLNANGNPDTSCSSNEFKDDNHQDYFANSELLNKINLASQMSMFQRTNHDLQSVLDKIELKIIKEPAKYHRARYMTEGSRGPIRDKSGKSFPTIKLIGYNKRPCQAICFLTDDKHRNTPHLFYQASKLTSRCLTNCTEVKLPNSNTNALQFELHPRNDMELMIDCLGIVKQRLFEIQQQQNTNSNPEKSAFKTPLCRLAFEVYIEEYNHVVKTYSDTIHCKQMMRAPEIHRMSIKECHISGDKELFIIGKNFSKDIKLYFKYENHWEECVTPVKELFHQAHLVCNVPKMDPQVMNRLGRPFTDKFGETSKRLTVELYAICDNKQSGKEQFTYYS